MKPVSLQLLIRFGYDGARFHGVQPQIGLATAGGALLQRVREAFGTDEIRAVSFASRTDAGVHADANWASCRVLGFADTHSSQIESIAATRDDGLSDVLAMTHPTRTLARAIAVGKHYRYVIEPNCGAPDATRRLGAWQVAPALDIDRMQRAADALVGTHDFSAYTCRRATGSRVKLLHDIQVQRDAQHRVVIDVYGQGFLRYMVRYIVGHLAAIGAGLESTSATADRLASCLLPTRVLRAPADGLRLVRVRLCTDKATKPAEHQHQQRL